MEDDNGEEGNFMVYLNRESRKKMSIQSRSIGGESGLHHQQMRPRSHSAYSTAGRQSRPPSSAGVSRTMSANVRRLHEALNNILPDHDRAYFVHALNEYNSRRNVYTLVANLKSILDSPERRQLYLLLGKVVPASDQALFWQHAEPLYNERRRHPETNGRTNKTGGELRQKHYYDTMPSRTRPPDLYRNNEPHGKTHRKTSGSSWEADAHKDIRRVVLKKSDSPDGELGFSIRGGSEHSVGIFVSLVEPNTMAERKGLQPGDQIIQVNEIPLDRITHGDAVKVLKNAKKLVLYVKSVGRVPGSFVSHQTYTWVDPQGRSVSPPPDVDLLGAKMSESLGRKSGLNLLKDGDEKKVNLVVEDGQSLGLMIRGGREFGLGIYITGVDAYSVAEYASLKVGDQILDVNGENFLDIDHQEAVNILKSSKLMMMTIKDVGKLPYARTTIDRTQWITGDGVSDLSSQTVRPASAVNGEGSGLVHNGGAVTGGPLSKNTSSSNFSRGIAGTQVMYNSTLGTGTQAWGMIEDQARHLLNENERGTMMYYLGEYQNGTINVDALVMALFELLNTHAKFSLFSEIRSFMFPRDIDHFDSLVLKREVASMKARQRGHFMNERESLFGDTFSTSSHYSSSSIDSRPITPPHVPAQLPPFVKTTSDPEDWPHTFDLRQINEDASGLPDFSLPDFAIDPSPPTMIRPSSGHQKASRVTPAKSILQSSQKTVTVDVHHREEPTTSQVGKNGPEGIYGGSVKSPSEDSGVDVQLNGSRASRRSGDRVTISPVPPVTIHSPASLSDRESPMSSLGSPQSASSPEPPAPAARPGRPRRSLARRLSLDSLSTEGSSIAALGESPQKLSVSSSEHSIPRRISDPTHHVPREQKRNVEQNKKASEALLALKKQPRTKTTLAKPANPPPPPPAQFLPPTASRSSTPPPPPPIPAPPPPRAEPRGGAGRPPPPPPPRQGSVITTRPAQTHPLQDQPGTLPTPGGSKRAPRTNGHSNVIGTSEHDPEEKIPLVNLSDEFPEGIELISVRKTKPNLGIAVEGGAGTRQPIPKIIKVQYGGSAYHNSNLKVGHVILKVNGRSLQGLTHQQATRCIAEAFKNKANDGINFLVIDSNRYTIQY